MPRLTTAALCVCFAAFARVAGAQQPFATDDADVTPKGVVHVEIFDEYDWLQRELAPHVQQNTFNMRVNYGVGSGLELDLDSPLIAIVNDASATPRLPFGIGDTDFGVKYNFRVEKPDSRVPALTAVLYIETPTGDAANGLGSGLIDTWMYVVAQKTAGGGVTLRANAGYLFTGNPSTGVVGITGAHGHVATMSVSAGRKMSDAVSVGVEVAGAVANSTAQDRTELQGMLGAKYALRENMAVTAGLIAGHFAASPRLGVQVGFSIDR